MKKKEVDLFFKALATQISEPLQFYITGGVASWLMGGHRPTQDIDFAVRGSKNWNALSEQIYKTSQTHKIVVEFAEDISRWGMIGLADFTLRAKLYKKFGSLQVYLLEPSIWSIGKISRYLADDISDLEIVFKKQKVKPETVIKTWIEALKESPKSSEQILFVKKVEDFLKNSGPKIWGKKFGVERYSQQFRNLCKLS